MLIKKIDKYILKNFLLTFFFLLVIFSAVAIVFDYTEKMKDFVVRKPPTLEVFLYFSNFLPYILALLFPIFIFVAVILFTSRLANRIEIIAILNTGMSYKRFLRPYIMGASVICVILLVANHFIIPKANKKRLQFEEKYVWERSYSKDDNVHMRISPTEYIFMQTYNPESKTGFRFSYEVIDGNLLKEKWNADKCVYDTVKKMWKLSDVVIRYNDTLKEELVQVKEKYKVFKFLPDDLIQRREARQMMTTSQLNKFIQREEAKGSEGLSEYYIEKYRRTSTPFSAFVLSIIGACLASRKVRGGSGVHVALGLMISAIYIFTMQFTTTFAIKGNLHPMLAVWIPNIIFSFLAYYIYRKYSK